MASAESIFSDASTNPLLNKIYAIQASRLSTERMQTKVTKSLRNCTHTFIARREVAIKNTKSTAVNNEESTAINTAESISDNSVELSTVNKEELTVQNIALVSNWLSAFNGGTKYCQAEAQLSLSAQLVVRE